MNDSTAPWKLGKPGSILIVLYALALTAYTAVTKIEGPPSIVNQVRVNTTRLSVLETQFVELKAQMSYNRDENKQDHDKIIGKIDILLRETRVR